MLLIMQEILMKKNQKKSSKNRLGIKHTLSDYKHIREWLHSWCRCFSLEYNTPEAYLKRIKQNLRDEFYSENEIERMLNNITVIIHYTKQGKLICKTRLEPSVASDPEPKTDHTTLEWMTHGPQDDPCWESNDGRVKTSTISLMADHIIAEFPKNAKYHEVEKYIMETVADGLKGQKGAKMLAKKYLHSQIIVLSIRNGNKHYMCSDYANALFDRSSDMHSYLTKTLFKDNAAQTSENY